jgi:hypothetical protein
MLNHFAVFYNEGGTSKNPFNHNIEDQEGYLQLIVINGNGDMAIYGDEYLGLTEKKLVNFTIHPNPTDDIIYITSTNSKILSASIYTVAGKLS